MELTSRCLILHIYFVSLMPVHCLHSCHFTLCHSVIPCRQLTTGRYTELRAAFRNGSDYDPAESCSIEKGGRLPQNFRVDLRDKH